MATRLKGRANDVIPRQDRQHGGQSPLAPEVSEQTFYRRKKKFAGMGVAEVRRLKA